MIQYPLNYWDACCRSRVKEGATSGDRVIKMPVRTYDGDCIAEALVKFGAVCRVRLHDDFASRNSRCREKVEHILRINDFVWMLGAGEVKVSQRASPGDSFCEHHG